MTSSTQQPQVQQQTASATPKSVWKKFNDSTASSASQPQLNGTTDDAHERDSVSSKDIAHGEGSSQGHSTPASSMTENETQPASPTPPAPTPIYRPAPLPAVNPWKVRKEEIERKRWKESQETPPVPLTMERSAPRPPTTAAPKPHTSSYRPNGTSKLDVRASARRSTKTNNAAPPALEDSEAWPSPDVAAMVEKEERSRSTTTTSTKDVAKDIVKETREGEPREAKEPRESGKKKKWEKLEVNITINPPPHMNRRGRGGKVNRNGRGGTRDSSGRGRDLPNDRPDREEKSRSAPRSDGEDVSIAAAKDSALLDRRGQSLSFDPGHRPHDMPRPDWTMRAPVAHEPQQLPSEGWQGEPSRSFDPQIPNNVPHDMSTQRSRSPESARGKNSSSPAGSKRGGSQEPQHSPSGSQGGRPQPSEIPHQWEDQESPSQHNHIQSYQQSNGPRRSAGRTYRGRNAYTPNNFPQGQYMSTPQQMPYQGFYPIYPPPMQPGFVPPARSHSLPYYQPHSPSRYPQAGYSPQWIPGASQLGLQPVPLIAIDEEMKQRITHQVEYYFSNDNLVKDTYLRKKMDSQGFVPLQVLVQFNRLSAIAHDVHTLQLALLGSNELELLSSSERGPLVRARQDPTKWVYPLNERDEIARHPGPAPSYFQMQQMIDRQMQEYQQYPYPQPYFVDPQYGFPTAPFRPQDQDIPSPPVDMNPQSPSSPMQAQFDPQNRKLSGEASVFVPNGVHFAPPMTNGDMGAYDLHSLSHAVPTVCEESDEAVENFEDDNLSNVILTINDPKDKPIVPALPVNGVNQKSSNETPEQTTLRSPLQPLTWRFSDATAATQASTSMSVNSGLSSLTAHEDLPQKSRGGGTALTENNLKKQLSQSGITEYTYPEFRTNAIQSRESSQKSKKESTEMVSLYQFWADFLRGFWTPAMYSDFTRYAIEDANWGRRTGLLRLFNMYESVLLNKFRISLWSDFVRLAGEDYRNGYLAGIESVWRIRGIIASKGRPVPITDGDVLRLVETEIQQPSDLDRLRREVKPAGVVLVPYTNVHCSLDISNRRARTRN